MKLRTIRRRLTAGLGTLLLLLAAMSATGFAADAAANYEPNGSVVVSVELAVTVRTCDGALLTGARVALQEPDNFAQTDEDGRVLLTGLTPEIHYQIIVSHSGYQTLTYDYAYTLAKENGDYPTDRVTLVLQTTAYDRQGVLEAVEPVGSEIICTLDSDSGSVRLDASTLEQSAGQGSAICLYGPTGEIARLAPLSTHDLALIGSAEVAFEATAGQGRIALRVPRGGEAGLAHSVLDSGLDVEVSFADDALKTLRLSGDQLAALVPDGCDLALSWSSGAYLTYYVQNTAHDALRQVRIPAAAFRFARENALGLKCRIYDPETGQTPTYEWIFLPEDVAGATEMDFDVQIFAAPESGDAIATLAQGDWCQFVISSARGALPCAAVLRVRELESFPQGQSFCLAREQDGALEIVRSTIAAGTDGWFRWEMTEGAAYVLLAASAEPDAPTVSGADTADDPVAQSLSTAREWGLIALLCAMLALLVLAYALHKKAFADEMKVDMRNREDEAALQPKPNPVDTHWEVVHDDE